MNLPSELPFGAGSGGMNNGVRPFRALTMDKNHFKSIIDYLKGENPLGMSYIVGFS